MSMEELWRKFNIEHNFKDWEPSDLALEDFVVFFMSGRAPGRHQPRSPQATELPDALGFSAGNGGTTLSKTEDDGDLAGFKLTFNGFGFTVDGNGNPTAGTVTDFEVHKGNELVATFEFLSPPSITGLLAAIEAGSGDYYSLTNYADLAELLVPSGAFLIGTGSDDADTFFGSTGNDEIDAKKGNDFFYLFEGDDELDGNVGSDTVDGVDVANAIVIDLARDKASHADFESKLIAIENANGSQFGDTIRGDNGNNRLFGRGGDDILFGKGGRDVFVFDFDGSADQLRDFQDGTDKLNLTLFEFASKSLALKAFDEVGSKKDDRVEFSFEGTTVALSGADLKDITGADIVI